MDRLLALSAVVAVVSWTATHEEIFREPREYCAAQANGDCPWWKRKFFYVFTCPFCLSHYVAAALIFVVDYRLIYPGLDGRFVAWYALVAIANVFTSLYRWLRLRGKLLEVQVQLGQQTLERERRR